MNGDRSKAEVFKDAEKKVIEVTGKATSLTLEKVKDSISKNK